MMKNLTSNNTFKYYLILHLQLFILSLSGICSKLAAGYDFLSFKFIFWYGLVILNLGVYAIVWQQIIKHLPLTTAYANKAVGIVWGIMWGVLVFHEQIKWNMILGAVIVIVGVILVVKSDE